MHIPLPVLAVLCSSIATTLSSAIPGTNQLLSRANSGFASRYETGNCTAENASVRKEWRALSKPERKRYTDAVLCLRKKPGLYTDVKGAKSRFDDFQVLHIKKTFIVHFNAQFLGWHRWFLWTYDEALKRECGYKGPAPYWDWTLDGDDLETSPLFDGSPYSMSGNGEFIPNRPTIVNIINLPTLPLINSSRSPGSGGGCVTTGPFAYAQVPFAPTGETLDTSFLNNPHNLDYQPHCLRRDLNVPLMRRSFTSANVERLLESPNITYFNNEIEIGQDLNYTNLHGAGHFGVGQDMRDTFTSPGDPIFFLHHAQVDRLWYLWQNRNLTERQYAITGTGTMFNYPPSPEFRLNDTVDLEVLSPGGPRPIREVMNTLGGPFCYKYV
ncbi:hypothetical protein MMC22_003618 [Lobaria immixta]|nr:hypothetical protein [Lobaria immixta]